MKRFAIERIDGFIDNSNIDPNPIIYIRVKDVQEEKDIRSYFRSELGIPVSIVDNKIYSGDIKNSYIIDLKKQRPNFASMGYLGIVLNDFTWKGEPEDKGFLEFQLPAEFDEKKKLEDRLRNQKLSAVNGDDEKCENKQTNTIILLVAFFALLGLIIKT